MPETISYYTNIQQKLCLATVSNKEYWPGTYVMIKSFLKHNTWFNGDIVIITNDKLFFERKIQKRKIKALIVKPSDRLFNQIQTTHLDIEGLKTDELFKIELFNLKGYDRIIYYDSDILHLSKIEPATIFQKELIAVIDPWFQRGYKRNRTTLKKVKVLENMEHVYENYINSGFLVIGKAYLNQKVYLKLIDAVSPELFTPIDDILADEPVFNHVFENLFDIAPVSFNCSIHLMVQEFVSNNAVSLHFTGKNKPWKLISWINLPARNRTYFKYLLLWMKIFFRA